MHPLITIALFSQMAFGRDVSFKKKVNAGALQAELVAAGFSVQYIECSRDNCVVHLSPDEKKDPLPVIQKYKHVDPIQERKKKTDALRAAHDKWRAGTITAKEKDRLIRDVIGMMLGR
jgi:hypothetical protein